MAEFEYTGFKEFEKSLLKTIKKDAPELHEQLLDDLGGMALNNASKLSPVDTGRLRASLEMKPYKGRKEWVKERNGDTIIVGTNVEYALPQEEGFTHYKSKNFVKGEHFFKKGLKQTEKQAPEHIRNFLKEMAERAGFDVKG